MAETPNQNTQRTADGRAVRSTCWGKQHHVHHGDVCVAHVSDFTDRKTVGAAGERRVDSHERSHKKATLPSSPPHTSEVKRQELPSQVLKDFRSGRTGALPERLRDFNDAQKESESLVKVSRPADLGVDPADLQGELQLLQVLQVPPTFPPDILNWGV